MTLTINRQEEYSRGELLLRTFLGWIYIIIPHFFVLLFLGLWEAVLSFVKFWVVLFTGQIPESIYEYQKKLYKWNIRLTATMFNMRDGYPALGLDSDDPDATIEFGNPETVSRGLVLVRALFGYLYVGIPHGFLLYFFAIGVSFVQLAAWFVILFTGDFPENMYNFILRYLRWSMRVSLYMGFYTDDYPPFNGDE